MTNMQTQANLKTVSVESFSTHSSLQQRAGCLNRKSNLKINHTTSSYSRIEQVASSPTSNFAQVWAYNNQSTNLNFSSSSSFVMTTSSFRSRVNIFHKLLTQTINKTKSKIATRRVNRLLKMCRTGGVLSPVIVTDIVDFCYTLGDRSHDDFQL